MDTEEWIDELSQSGEAQEVALRDLRAELESGLPYALSRWLSPNDPGFSLIQESIQEALLKVLEKLESFDGRSKFTTWVYKIAIHEALSELRRKRWQNVSLEELLHTEEDRPILERIESGEVGPEMEVSKREIMARIGDITQEELTDRRRKALIVVGAKGMPTAEVARQMDTNRNALYKLMHDARLKLESRILQEGLVPEEVLFIVDS